MPLNAVENDTGRFYTWTKKKFISVTTVISQGIPKMALDNWKRQQVVNRAIADHDYWWALPEDEQGAYLIEGDLSSRNEAGDKGSAIHRYAEEVIKGLEITPQPREIRSQCEQFDRFCDDFQPVWIESECTVYSNEGYAGTADAYVQIGGVRYVLDFKTGKRIYPEVALQLAAYRYADFIGRADGTESPVPEVDSGAVLHILPRSYSLRTVRADETVFGYFEAALNVVDWNRTYSAYVIGGELVADLG